MPDVDAMLGGWQRWRVLQGDVFSVLPTLPPGSVDCCVTSPPYWQLRSYLPKDDPLKPFEIGAERTPQEYVEQMVRVFDLVKTALADHGTCWVNIGDTYCDDSKHGGATSGKHVRALHGSELVYRDKKTTGIPAGNMALIPQRLAIALQDAGWVVRSVVVWAKPAPMPASLFGWRWERCRKKVSRQKLRTDSASHRISAEGMPNGKPHTVNASWLAEWTICAGCEKCAANAGYILRRGSWRPTSSWEPILMLAKSQRYFADGEAVKTPPAEATISRDQYTRILDDDDEQFAVRHDHETICDGANLRDVWRIGAEPLAEKHYAAFPTELVLRCLKAGTSAHGYCAGCGKPWTRKIDVKTVAHPSPASAGLRPEVNRRGGAQANGSANLAPEVKTLGWLPSCLCVADVRSGLVLDPFCGSGRTGITARRLGLNFVGVELNPAYVGMSERLITDDSPLFNGAP
jgi:DNA modification methylase